MGSMMFRRLREVPVGERVLIGHSRNDYRGSRTIKVPVLSVRTVADASDGDAIKLVGPYGENQTANRDGDIAGSPMRDRVMWTNSLPNGTDDQILAYAKTVGTAALASHVMFAMFLHVEDVSEGRIVARPVYPSSLIERDDPGAFIDSEMSRPAPVVEGNAAFHEQLVVIAADTGGAPKIEEGGFSLAEIEAPTVSVGDLIGAPDFLFRQKDGEYTATLTHATVIGNFKTQADVGAFLPPSLARPVGWWSGSSIAHVAADDEIERELSRAIARSEPDEALFLWYPEAGSRPDTACAVLGHQGIIFHEVDAPADYFWNEGIKPGLWIFEKASFWSSTSYEGEHDCGIEGDWRPATIEDLDRFGFDPASLDEEIAEYLELEGREDREFDGSLTMGYLEAAADACEQEKSKDDTMSSVSPAL